MPARRTKPLPVDLDQPLTPAGLRTWERGNLKQEIRRREGRLQRSMAHTPKPRLADLERWRVMEVELERLRVAFANLPPPKTRRRS